MTVRVKAGPGSGKTRVVVARTLHLITGPTAAAPSRILAITFTNKAARELKERLAGAAASSGRHIPVEMAAGGVTAMTFHSLGSYMLRVILNDGAEADGLRKGFRVVDADQSERLIMKAVFNVDSQQQQERKAWAETAGQLQGPKGGPPLLPPLTTTAAARLTHQTAELLYDIKAWAAAKGHYNSDTAVVAARAALAAVRDKVPKEPQLQDWHPPAVSGPPPSPYSEEAKEANEAAAKARWCVAQLQRYYTEYHRLLRVEHNAADFSDLLCLPTRVLDTCPEHRERWRGRWDHILVDEFQDTDSVQYLLVRLLRSPSASLFVVGDPDQSIYSWRGAQPDNMRNFLPRDYQDTKTYILPTNYRSDPAIVAKADTLLRSACDRNAMGMGARSNGEKDGDPYDLYRPAVAARPGSSGGEHAVVQSCSYSDPEEEARVIAEHIMKWNRVGAGASPAVPLREIAVLYRNRALSLPLEQELARWGIRFTVVGGQPFWEYKDVRAAVCYLHVAAHPLHSDTWLERVANEPKRGLGDATVDALRVAAAAAGLTLGGLLFGDFVHDPTGPQQLQAAPGEAGAAAAAGQGQGEEPAPAPAAAKRKTRAKAKAAEGEGTAAATGPARYAPAIPPSSPLARVKLGAKAKAGIMELRGIVRSMRLALGVEPAPAGAEPGGGEGAVGAAVKPRPSSFSSSPSPAKTVGQVVATLLGPDLTGLETAALEEAAVEVTAAGGKAAARDKGDKGSGATERLQRYGLLKQVAAAPETWVSADMPPEDAGPAPAGGPAAADVGLPGLQRFLEHIALVTSQDVDASGQRDAVRLTTIHAAKGLEFERVFVIGLEHGLLPSGRCDTREALEEELRLLYVALTRAKDQLHLSMCKGRMHQGKWDGYRRLSGLAVALGLDFPQYGGAGAAAGSGGYSGGGWPARGSGSSGGGRVPPRGLRRATMPHKRET